MKVILVRCANGLVVWVQHRTAQHSKAWMCTRDNFVLAEPSEPGGLSQFLATMQQHSVSLMGAIQQLTELEF